MRILNIQPTNNFPLLKIIIICFIFGGVFSGCVKNSPEQVEITSTPIPPSLLQELPRPAKTICLIDPSNNRVKITLWEFPGLPSRDPGSSRGSHTGTNVGFILSCSETIVTDYAWSTTDQEFYVLVSNDENVQGWLRLEFVILED